MDKPPRVPNSGSFKKGDPRCGRPTKYNEALAQKICDGLASGKSLRRVLSPDEMPTMFTVLRWAMDPKHPFSTQYEKAREIQAETLADELQDISDDGSNDFYIGKQGPMFDKEHVMRSKLRVDTRKWIASKLKPKRYGDKVQTEHSGKVGLMSWEKLVDESRKEE